VETGDAALMLLVLIGFFCGLLVTRNSHGRYEASISKHWIASDYLVKGVWINTVNIIEWLSSFYRHVGSRSVILSIDNLEAHINTVESVPPSSNVYIIWLPKTPNLPPSSSLWIRASSRTSKCTTKTVELIHHLIFQ